MALRENLAVESTLESVASDTAVRRTHDTMQVCANPETIGDVTRLRVLVVHFRSQAMMQNVQVVELSIKRGYRSSTRS